MLTMKVLLVLLAGLGAITLSLALQFVADALQHRRTVPARTDWKVGDTAEITRDVTRFDIWLFAFVSGDMNPVHLFKSVARTTMFGKCLAHGMLSAGYISAVLGTKVCMSGHLTIYRSQNLSFEAPVFPGDMVTTKATVTEYDPVKKKMVLDVACTNQTGTLLVKGPATLYFKPMKQAA